MFALAGFDSHEHLMQQRHAVTQRVFLGSSRDDNDDDDGLSSVWTRTPSSNHRSWLWPVVDNNNDKDDDEATRVVGVSVLCALTPRETQGRLYEIRLAVQDSGHHDVIGVDGT